MAIVMKAMEPLAVDDTRINICCSNSSLQIAASSRVSAAKPSSTNDDDSLDVQQIMTTYEPLKVCLDDDSSIEDGDDDDDMFDDDAFTFGDEDFQALMAHDNMKKVTASITSHESGRISAASTTTSTSLSTSNASHIPLHNGTSIDSGTVVESLPSTAASSQTSLGTLQTNTSYTSCASLSRKTKSKRRVSLKNDVAVIPIPMRTEYSSLVKARIWSSANELTQNAARNTLEFAAEGFNWRNVADDEQMVQSPSGERIHPIHYMNLSSLSCNALSC